MPLQILQHQLSKTKLIQKNNNKINHNKLRTNITQMKRKKKKQIKTETQILFSTHNNYIKRYKKEDFFNLFRTHLS